VPNTRDRGAQQPGSSGERKREQLNDQPLEETDDDTEEGRIEARGIEDDEVTAPRTEREMSEDQDLADDATTQVNSNRENRRNDREQATAAGRKANDASD